MITFLKTECMVVDGLWQCFTHKNYRVLYVTPYETQVNLIFMRMREVVQESPMIKEEVVKMKNSPYMVEFSNGSVIMGFTTGASTGSAASSVRGQRADWLFLDELDYMGEGDFGTVSAIANERADIGITASSTPTGRRSTFWRMCNEPDMGYHEYHIQSQKSPLWTQAMEIRTRAELTQQEYEHEVLAEFGTEEVGVFDKDALDDARRQLFYTYDPLNVLQEKALEGKAKPLTFIFKSGDRAPQNLIRTCGCDFDKYQAGSSIVVLDYDMKAKKFWVMKRIEVPRSEYTLDNAVNKIIEVNEIYDPRWIFLDRGYGEKL